MVKVSKMKREDNAAADSLTHKGPEETSTTASRRGDPSCGESVGLTSALGLGGVPQYESVLSGRAVCPHLSATSR